MRTSADFVSAWMDVDGAGGVAAPGGLLR